MEVVVFADTPTKPVGPSLLGTLVEWEGPATILTSSVATADDFCAQRTKPFTRCLQNTRWVPMPLPPMTLSVESNILSVLAWQHESLTQKMQAFQEAARNPQSSRGMLFLIATRGLRDANVSAASEWFQGHDKVVVLTAKGLAAMVYVPENQSTWFFDAWLHRQTQASQEMLDALLDQPLTMEGFQAELGPSHMLSTFQWMVAQFPDAVMIHDVDLQPAEFASSAMNRLVSQLQAANPIPVNDVTGTGAAWVFFALVTVVVVLGFGMAFGHWGRTSTKFKPSRWSYLGT